MLGEAYGLETVALRYLNTYGPRQALGNPYTGVAAIFAARVLSGRAPLVFEDGGQIRDLVHVSDVVRATLRRWTRRRARPRDQRRHRSADADPRARARRRRGARRPTLEPELTGEFRAGDIRHCLADTTRARELLGFEAPVELLPTACPSWRRGWPSRRVEERGDQALAEMRARNLVG